MRRLPSPPVRCVICQKLRYSDRVTRCLKCGRSPVCRDDWDDAKLVCRECAKEPFKNTMGMPFVAVPPGSSGSKIQMCQWETRVADFRTFSEATQRVVPDELDTWDGKAWTKRKGSWQSPGFEQGEDHPVVGVSWEDAVAFCSWLTKEERGSGKIRSTAKYRLPTDSEWSWAVGLGEDVGKTPQEKHGKVKDVYPWGTEWPPPKGAGNFADESAGKVYGEKWGIIKGYDDGYAQTSPVGAFKANALGLFDMAGNVWEWCDDWYNAEKNARVLRGGSWAFMYRRISCRLFAITTRPTFVASTTVFGWY